MNSHTVAGASDPFLRPSFPLAHRVRRQLWNIVALLLFRPSPRPAHAWRAFLLGLFGARLGKDCHIYPSVEIWAPWNLRCGEVVAIADGAVIYNPQLVSIGSHAIISQQAYLCGASHDYTDPAFPLVSAPIQIGARAWICARAAVQMNVRVGEGAVLGLASVATRDLEPWTVYAGIPARPIKSRSQCGGRAVAD
jgi:putative colanic acid biosynthesis acetyltransferase WcaF